MLFDDEEDIQDDMFWVLDNGDYKSIDDDDDDMFWIIDEGN